MSERFIVRVGVAYLTPRRATGAMYVSRTALSRDINDAKVFNTKGAAGNSAKSSKAIKNKNKIEILPVKLVVIEMEKQA